MQKIRTKELQECAYCGKQFYPRYSAVQKFCSYGCRREKQKAKDREMCKTVTCLRCGKPFVTTYKSTRSLCDPCKEKKRAKWGCDKEERKPKAKRDDAKLMRAVRESGLSYGQYMSGTALREDAYTSLTRGEGWSSGWITLGEEAPAPRAIIKVNAARLPEPPLPYSPRGRAKQEKKVYKPSPVDTSETYRRMVKTDKKGVPYTEEEDATIIQMHDAGETYTTIALTIGRMPTSVKNRYQKITGTPA